MSVGADCQASTDESSYHIRSVPAMPIEMSPGCSFTHNFARGSLDAKTDGFLVYVESDIVRGIHGVLPVSFLSRRFLRRPQHRSRSENPSSFHLCIHTDGTFPSP